MGEESKIIDAEAVHIAKEGLPSEYSFVALELFYKVFADTTRIKILFALILSKVSGNVLSIL